MENPQAQMQQGQPGMAPEQMQQGQPQQGGQDQQMQQIMQMVQQMMQQGAQPADAAAELLGQQVPPEIIMQVFVQMGMPEQDAQMAIEQAMQGGQQPQGQGEEQMEGQASNPQEEMAEQGTPAPEQGGQPSPAEEIQMRYGGRMPRRLRSYAEGGDTQEMQAVMQKVQDMMAQGSDPRQVMEQIQAAIQQGQISPEVGTSVMEQLSGMQQATDPQGSDVAMTNGSQDPQAMDPNMVAPESQMMKFGGNLKKLMSRAYGGPAVAPAIDSKNYAKDRATMFVNAVKNNTFKSTLDDDFPSLGGNQMAYGGNLPKADKGLNMADYKTKDEAELAAYRYRQSLSPEEQAKFDLEGTLKTWKAPEPTYEAGKNYSYDPATKQFKVVAPTNQFQFAEGDIMGQDAQGAYVTRKDGSMMRVPSNQMQGAQTYNSQINPVAYQNPYGTGLFGNLAASASPFGRMVANFGTNNMYDPRITGTNLPGGMSGQQFLGAIGANGLIPGMAGNVAGQNWRIGQGEEFKEGSIWKGNRRKGVRYQIDWGDAAAMNPNTQATTTNPYAGNSTPMGPQNQIVDPSVSSNPARKPALDANGAPLISDGSNMMWNSNPPLLNTAASSAPVAPTQSATQPVAPVNSKSFEDRYAIEQGLQQPDSTVVQPKNNISNQSQQRASFYNPTGDFMNENPQDFEFPSLQPNPAVTNPSSIATPVVNSATQPIAPVVNQPSVATVADQSLVVPQATNVVNPASEVNPIDQSVNQNIEAAPNTFLGNNSMLDVYQSPTYSFADHMNKTVPNQFVSPKDIAPQDQVLWGQDGNGNKIPIVQPPVKEKKKNFFNKNNTVVTPPATNKPNWQKSAADNWTVGKNESIKEKKEEASFGTDPSKYLINGSLPEAGTPEDKAYWQAVKNREAAEKTEAYKNKLKEAEQKKIKKKTNNDKILKDAKANFGYQGDYSNGGSVDPAALENAIALINRAFGGMIPKAVDGIDLGSEDTDANKIPDYLQAENLPANPFGNKGTMESSAGKKMNIDWRGVAGAAGDMYMNNATKLTSFMNDVNAFNPERENAKYSALDRPSNTYNTMNQGSYDQAGNFIPNDIGNEVLNPTNSNFNNQRQIFAYGGKVYEIGGEVDLEDDELEQLAAAGFKLSRV